MGFFLLGTLGLLIAGNLGVVVKDLLLKFWDIGKALV
jgi:hypothetical protein